MKILLINPPRSPFNGILEHASKDVLPFIHRKLVGPPLGLLTLAEAVKDHSVAVFDMKGEYDLLNDAPSPAHMIGNTIEEFRPDIVGITVIASELPVSLELISVVKQFSPETVTVAGGLQATLCPDSFNGSGVDVLCPGMSAHVFRNLCNAIESRTPLLSVPGIMVRNGDKYRPTAAVGPKDAAGKDFILPNRSHLKRWISTYTVGNGKGPVTYLFTSLGCPHKCTFCSIWPQHQGFYHQREVDSVIDELKRLDDYPIVRFADANTIVNIQWINQLFDSIEREGIRKEYVMDIRADTAAHNPELIRRLARNGLRVVICGFESFREDELEKYGKSSSAALISRAVEVFHDNGISVRGNYVIPTDYTENDFDALKQYASSHKVTHAGYTILTPMPGTMLYDEMADQIIDTDLSKYNFFNAVTRTHLDKELFYRKVSDLWKIKKGTEVI
ncbi:MAG: B12-binding domain-containing radical SAM protein [Fibrobacterota bacterium]